MNGTRPSAAPIARFLLSLCAALMVVLAVVFFTGSTAGVASQLVQGFIAALCLAAALPYLWLLLLMAREWQRRACALGDQSSCEAMTE